MFLALKKDIPDIIQILTPAFADNLSVNRCVKQDQKRLNRIENQIRYISRLSIRNKMAYINKAKTAAILCHLSYGKKANIWDDLYFIFKVSGIKLVLQILKREKLLKDLHPKTKFCHLWFIGVKNELQGQGHGSQMLDAIKSICLGKQLPIYLETSNKDNINFYLNNGFVLEKTVQLPMDDFEIYLFSWQVSK